MKSKIYTVIFALVTLISWNASAQVAEISKLSKGNFYSYDAIKDANNNIRGYLMLFESDKVEKETFELEYVVLDENLTRVTNGYITEHKYESMLYDTPRIRVDIQLYKNKLLLELEDDNTNQYVTFRRYRILDIPSNKMTDNFICKDGVIQKEYNQERKTFGWKKITSEPMRFFGGVGLTAGTLPYSLPFEDEVKEDIICFDDALNKKWNYDYTRTNKKEDKRNVEVIESDEDVMVLFNHFSDKRYMNKYSLIMLDSKTGQVRAETELPGADKYNYRYADCSITDDEVYLYGAYCDFEKYGFVEDNNSQGLFMMVFNKADGKHKDTKMMSWKSVSGKIDIKENGKVKQEGFLYIHNMIRLSNGKVIVAAETFIQAPITTGNMYFFELDTNFSAEEILEVSKFKNKFPHTQAHSSEIKRYGGFDFIDYQNLGDDDYLFLLNDNEKNTTNRKKSTLYGIVSYVDGKFAKQTLNLKTDTSSIRAFNAKKGYIMLIEFFDNRTKSPELRLEKINY